MSDNVVPFGRPSRKGEPAAGVPAAEAALHPRTRRGQPGARALAAEQATPQREAYGAAVARQADEQLIATGRPVPARITWALDVRTLDGPEVDTAVGTEEGRPLDEGGDVDDWEAGRSAPTAEQVRALADLTDFPEAWFYRPVTPGPTHDGGVMCFGGRRGCEPIVPDVITPEGVLLYEGKPRDPKRPAVQGELLPGAAVPAAERPGRKRPAETPAARSTAARAPRKPTSSPAPVQPALDDVPRRPSGMPAHIRAELDARLAARRTPPG